MDLEREKGITIKARAVRLHYDAADGQTYALNLIDTPGPRRLHLRGEPIAPGLRGRHPGRRRHAGHRGPDAGQRPPGHGPEPGHHPGHQQDRPSLRRSRRWSWASSRTLWPSRARRCCWPARRTGPGCATSSRPSSRASRRRPATADAPLQALVFDSHYDQYKGVVAYVRLSAGTLHDHERIRFMATDAESEILELGYFRPQPVPTKRLVAGEVGYVATGLKSIREAQVGDTMTSAARRRRCAPARLQGAAAAGLRRHLPDARRRLSRAARRARQAPPQRRRLRLRAGVLGRARLRIPLRLPRPAAHGDHPGAPGARVRPRPDRLGAERRVPRQGPSHRGRGRGRQPGADAGSR